ncbi:transmembrane protein 61-like [Narcine bancroftii]|uniref:transmembrane protein 61-like n=1 Tax=Narcine bancroftii TaxID=1343680 RepID=UPI0038317495
MAFARMCNRLSIGGGVLLMSGAICFAWWSDKESHLSTNPGTSFNKQDKTDTHQIFLRSLLRLISVLFGLIGGLLLLFGLLWSAKLNRQMSSECIHQNRTTSYINITERRAKYRHSGPDHLQAPLYDEALDSRSMMMVQSNNLLIPVAPKDSNLPPSYETLANLSRVQLLPCRPSLSDSAIAQKELTQTWQKEESMPDSLSSSTNITPPPSYENLHLHVC